MIRRQTLRGIALLALLVATLVGAVLFYVKYQVSQQRERLSMVNKQIIEANESIHVLDAEWSYLNQPERLKNLNNKHGKLEPVNILQLASVDDFFDPDRNTKTRTMLASVNPGGKPKCR